jgi:hypothetical protein
MQDDHVYTVKEISLIGECVRKWASKYRHRLPDQKHPAAAAGIEVHAILERMLREGPQANVNPESEVGGWARALYPLTPPGAHAELEQPFEMNFGGQDGQDCFRSSFRIDWVAANFAGFGDWKTCAGEKWSVTDLSQDLQANLETYGFAKVMGFGIHVPVSLRWCYVDKKTGRAWPVDGQITFAQAAEWLRINALPRMRLIRALRQLNPVPPVAQFPHDITACGGSGRNCAFLGQCQFKQSAITTEQLYQLAR